MTWLFAFASMMVRSREEDVTPSAWTKLPLTVIAACALSFLAVSLSRAEDSSSPIEAAKADALRSERPFTDGNDAAMNKMMAAMAIAPTDDIDKDFVAMMVPHHQGAIDMAQLQLRYGHNQKLKYLAQEIIVTQQQEIAAMRLAVGEPLPPAVPSPTAAAAPDTMGGATKMDDAMKMNTNTHR